MWRVEINFDDEWVQVGKGHETCAFACEYLVKWLSEWRIPFTCPVFRVMPVGELRQVIYQEIEKGWK
jgi:hypothetical protein